MRLNVHAKRGKKGFTLVELLVTIVIIAIIGVFSFAIMMSSLNTFDKQKEVVDAVEVKNLVFESLKGFLQSKADIIVTTTNLAERKLVNGQYVMVTPEGEINIDAENPLTAHILDKKLTTSNMLYSSGGRIYIVESNTLGKYYIDENDMPLDADEYGLFGRKQLLDEYVYKGYDVSIQFMPLKTARTGEYQDLKVIVTVKDPEQNNIEVAYGYQIIHMLNIQNAKKSIQFRNITTNDDTPGDTPFNFLYFK